jgi:hypothetical protein
VSSERTAYLASVELSTAYWDYCEQLDAAHAATREHNRQNPDTPLWVGKAGIDHRVGVFGVEDIHPDQDPPAGLSRSRNRPYLIPKRGPSGQPWRDLIARFNAYPDLNRDVLKPHGVEAIRFGDLQMYGVGVTDCGEHGVFITTTLPFETPSEHLTHVPLSQYYAAKEARDAAVNS